MNNNQYWTDPIIGARIIKHFNNGANVNLAADIGGLSASKQYSYNIIALLGYMPQFMWRNTKWYIDYRLLDQLYENGNGNNKFIWDMKLSGPFWVWILLSSDHSHLDIVT